MAVGEVTVLRTPVPGTPPRPRVPRPERWTMDNGLRVVALARGGVPQVALRLLVPAGASADPEPFPGTAALVAALLTEGAGDLTAETLNARLDLLGASLGAQVGHDYAEVDLSALAETVIPAVELLALVVTRPTFPAAETERVRAETLDSLDARLDEPANIADDTISAALFGEHHPYGRLTSGTPEGVEAVPREQLMDFHARHYRPGGSILVVAGDFDPTLLRATLERELGGWSGQSDEAVGLTTAVEPLRSGERIVIPWEDAAQGEIRVAAIGMERAHSDWIPAAVANYLLGGSTITGRLGANLREDKGWTYGVRSGFAAALRPGGWSVETAVDVEVVERAVEEIFRELERFRREPVPQAELVRARDALTLSLPRAFETAGRIVSRFATIEAFGLAEDHWERFVDRVHAVEPDDIARMADRYFAPERMVTVVVGSANGPGTGGEGTTS